MSAEPIITCPNCQKEIKLTESLAAPLLEATRRQYEQRMAQKEADVAKREQTIKDHQAALAREKETIDQQVNQKLQQERAKIAADESKKARLALADDLNQKSKELADLQTVLQERNIKLAEAQKAQVDLIRKQRELDDAKREMELTIEKRIGESLTKTREQARREAEEQMALKVLEKEQTITAMQKQIEELKRRAEQGSQQAQGEALELQLEFLLGARFPHDRIQPVPKGEHGGDILHCVRLNTGVECGTILWESKRTKNWSNLWLPKLREDQRSAKAEIAVLVSAVLPEGVDTFGQVDGVWLTHPRIAVPVALSLRQTLIEVSSARLAGQGQQTKMDLLYQYLTGPAFRLRVQAVVEAFKTMKEDLQKEKTAITKLWAKREKQLELGWGGMVGMYGELEAIAGKTLQEIDGLDLKMLEAVATDE